MYRMDFHVKTFNLRENTLRMPQAIDQSETMSLLYCIYYRPTQTLADYVARDKWRYKDNITIMITLLKVAQTPTQKIQKMSSSSNDVNTLQCHCLFTSFKLLDIFCILRVDVLCTAVHERILRQYTLQQEYIWNHIRA